MPSNPQPLLRIVAPHFCAGIVPGVMAAPIVKFMVTWPLEDIERYCWRKGWTVETVPLKETPQPSGAGAEQVVG